MRRAICSPATAQVPSVPLNDLDAQVFAMTEIDGRSLRTLTTRFDTRPAGDLITVADARPAIEPAARFGFMSTLLWDFVQLDVTLVLVWVGIQLGSAAGEETARRDRGALAARFASHRRIFRAARNRSRRRHAEPPVRDAAQRRAVAAAVHRQHGASIAHADHRHAGAARPPGRRTRRAADQGAPPHSARRASASWRIRRISC